MTIHNEHPFLPAEGDRGPVRRLRGRLAAPVTVFTAELDGVRAGLTVSSMLVVDGEPGSVLAVLDPLSELSELLQKSGSALVNVLGWSHRQLADAFGYVAPAPGGPFRLAEWTDTSWGPALVGALGWAGCRLADRPAVAVGWGVQVQLTIEQVWLPETEPADPPLIHQRGRYHQL